LGSGVVVRFFIWDRLLLSNEKTISIFPSGLSSACYQNRQLPVFRRRFWRMMGLSMTSVIRSCSHMNNNLIQVLLIFFGGALCLLPLAAKPTSDFSHSELLIAVPSQRNRDSAVAAFALGLPILAEIVVEVITSITTEGKAEKVKLHIGRQLLNTRERFLLACGILTIPITAFFPGNTFQLVNMYLCLRKCRFMFVGGTVITSLSRYDVTFWSVRQTYSIVTCLIVGSVLGSYAENNDQRIDRQLSPLAIFAYGCYILALLILLYCNARWLLSIIPTYFTKQTLKPWLDKGSQKDLHITDAQLLIPLLYVATTGLVSILLSIIFRVSPEIDAYNSDALFYHHLALILYVVFIMYLGDRMMKYDVIRGLVSHSVPYRTVPYALPYVRVCCTACLIWIVFLSILIADRISLH
jgi:hypothetical protein